MTESSGDVTRVEADGETSHTPAEPTDEVIVAKVPGDDESKFVTIALSNPLNERDRVYLGLPADASTEVGQKVKVNRNGAKAIINAGYAALDPEDNVRVQAVLRGIDPDQPTKQVQEQIAQDVSPQSGEPTTEPRAEAPTGPQANPPQAKSTPVTPGPGGVQPGQKAGNTGGTQPSAEGAPSAPAKG